MVFHVLNRGVGRMRIFDDDGDFAAFVRIMEETLEIQPMRICAYCLMPNHWHLVFWPQNDGDLPALMQLLTNTHFQRWRQPSGCERGEVSALLAACSMGP